MAFHYTACIIIIMNLFYEQKLNFLSCLFNIGSVW